MRSKPGNLAIMTAMLEYQDEHVEPLKVTPGFIAFVAFLFLPIVAALVIYLGAWAVSSEVQAAEAATDSPGVSTSQDGFNTVSEHEVAGWKRTLVGVCPLH
jgi:hypothetical protein